MIDIGRLSCSCCDGNRNIADYILRMPNKDFPICKGCLNNLRNIINDLIKGERVNEELNCVKPCPFCGSDAKITVNNDSEW